MEDIFLRSYGFELEHICDNVTYSENHNKGKLSTNGYFTHASLCSISHHRRCNAKTLQIWSRFKMSQNMDSPKLHKGM
ncbi:hypothetical protein TNIN_138251 [Trichonephila inaurata madagascariensis]|uniref:Uncharacterized protein n=1 Tax=Trichonephila inaurata madagascariensis TaxID=2747483 RepID=A0A8X7CMD4_9ARAC|nr:hypothetical protein TNIN_138251 [Trichonephila inaurata madagascariensis]